MSYAAHMLRFCKGCRQSNKDVRFPSASAIRCVACTNRHNEARAERLAILRPVALPMVSEAEPDHRELGRIRSPRHLSWVKEHYRVCCIPGCTKCRFIHPHHLTIAQPKTMKVKAGDNFVLNLGDWHHQELHDQQGNEREFWQSKGVNPFPLCFTAWLASPFGERLIPTTDADWLIVASSSDLFPFQPGALRLAAMSPHIRGGK